MRADRHPDDVHDGGRDRAVVSSVDHEADGSADVHQLIGSGPAVQLVRRQETVREQHQRRADPSHDLDKRLHAQMIVSAWMKFALADQRDRLAALLPMYRETPLSYT